MDRQQELFHNDFSTPCFTPNPPRTSPEVLHKKLDRYARLFCPPIALFDSLSLSDAVEYATDIVFAATELAPIYEALVRTAMHA